VAGVLGKPDAPQNSDIEGVSIFAAMEGKPFDRGYQFWHYPHISPQDQHSEAISGGTYVSAIRKDDWKLIFFYDDRHYELYDLATDLGEANNVLKQNPQVAEEMSGALQQRRLDQIARIDFLTQPLI